MALIIDSHSHVFPDRLKQLTPATAYLPLEAFRKKARVWLRPVMGSLHKAQIFLRHLPEGVRKPLDEIGALVPLPTFLLEHSVSDLNTSLDEAGVDYALVIAHPPLSSNDFILDRCAENPRLKAVVNIPPGTAKPGATLKRYAEKGAIALKIHPAADGEGIDSPRYRALLKAAEELGMPVILHTGCLHTHLHFKNPELGRAQIFAPWFEAYKSIRFILAHSNFHEPLIALDLAEKYENVFLETSWQPAEIIGEAVRRIGAERILMGSDWPFLGDNLNIAIEHIETALNAGTITAEQKEMILGLNAARLFNIL